MNRTELKEASGISFNVLARLGKNEPVSFETIEKICFTLNCEIEDVVELKKDSSVQIEKNAFTTIELFAGCGGLVDGFEKSNKFTALACVEWNKAPLDVLKKRFKNKYFFVCNDNIFHTFANGIMVLLPCK